MKRPIRLLQSFEIYEKSIHVQNCCFAEIRRITYKNYLLFKVICIVKSNLSFINFLIYIYTAHIGYIVYCYFRDMFVTLYIFKLI